MNFMGMGGDGVIVDGDGVGTGKFWGDGVGMGLMSITVSLVSQHLQACRIAAAVPVRCWKLTLTKRQVG